MRTWKGYNGPEFKTSLLISSTVSSDLALFGSDVTEGIWARINCQCSQIHVEYFARNSFARGLGPQKRLDGRTIGMTAVNGKRLVVPTSNPWVWPWSMSANQASGNCFTVLTVQRSSSSSLDHDTGAWQVELVSVEPCQTCFFTKRTSSRSV